MCIRDRYERYNALSCEETGNRRNNVKGVSDARPESQADMAALQRQVTEVIERMSTATNSQLQKLTDAMTKLSTPALPGGTEPSPSSPPLM